MSTISIVCIVKNREEPLRKCVDSVKNIIDEFIIVDTGSTDNTKNIIEEYGKLYEMPFENYVTTKNKALELATSDYILFMDSDEYVLEGLTKLKEYADNNVDSVCCRIVEGTDDLVTNTYFRNRLWKNKKDHRFKGCGIHEYISVTGDTINDSSIKVRHDHSYKKNKPEVYKERFESYIIILKDYISKNPTATREHFYLARTYKDMNYVYKAIDTYKAYLELPSIFYKDEIWQSWYDMASCYKGQGEYTNAIDALNNSIKVDSRRSESYNLLGSIYYNLQDYNKAVGYYKIALSNPFPEDVTLFINPMEYDFKPADCLSLCYDALKQFNKAEEYAIIAQNSKKFVDGRVCNNLWWFRTQTHLKIFLTLGNTPEKVYGGILNDIGVGGVETTYIELSKELSEKGHTVFLFCNCDEEHIYEGVYYIPYKNIDSYLHLLPDIVITSRWFESLTLEQNSKKVIWFQDAHFKEPSVKDIFNKVDLIICSSEWHSSYIAERYSIRIDRKKLFIIPLGIRKELFNFNIDRDKNKVIYSSNPDRGLYILLDMWEEITKELPNIQLYIYYGWEGLKCWGEGKAWKSSVSTQMNNTLDKIKDFNNIHFEGRLTKKELATEMLSSSLCLYPNNFNETFCITAIETQMAGTPMITTSMGALTTTLNNNCNILIEADPYSEKYKAIFIKELVNLMSDKSLLLDYSSKCKSSTIFSWDEIADLWEEKLWELNK